MECAIVCFGQRGLKKPKLDNLAPRCCASNDSAQCDAIRGPCAAIQDPSAPSFEVPG